jgi:hypothetical protein
MAAATGTPCAAKIRLGLVQATDSDAETADFTDWFQPNWDDLEPNPSAKAHFLNVL